MSGTPRLAGPWGGAEIAAPLSAVCAAALLAPVALHVSTGTAGRPDGSLAFLLLETVYALVAFAGLGLGRAGRQARRTILAAVGLPLAAGALAPLLFDADLVALLRAQPAIAGTALFAWGSGRAARRACRDRSTAVALALVAIVAAACSPLPAAHAMRLVGDAPRASELLLALSPFTAVSGAAGIDLARTVALYEAIPLSGYRFAYPRAALAPIPLALLGLLLGLSRRPARGTTATRRPVFTPLEEEVVR